MKFAKELERDCVPEWRLKYLDYKLGKKKLKAIRRALRNVNQTPRFGRRGNATFTPSPFDTAPKYSFVNRDQPVRQAGEGIDPGTLRSVDLQKTQSGTNRRANGSGSSLAREIKRSPEEQPLNGGQDQAFPGLTRYGSIIGSPPDRDIKKRGAPPSLKLPGAALDPDSPAAGPSAAAGQSKSKTVQLPPSDQSAFEVGKTRSPHKASASLPFRHRSIFTPKRVNSTPGNPAEPTARPTWKRAFSLSGKGTPPASPGDVPLEAFRDLDFRQTEFFQFLDMELEKVESFYKAKENEATERLGVLREQLHIMRDRRLDELIATQTAKIKAKEAKKGSAYTGFANGQQSSSDDEGSKGKSPGGGLNVSWLNPVDSALEAVQAGRYGKSTKAMTDLATPTALRPQDDQDNRRDYIRRPDMPDVPYHSARRKLKVAMQEYYRGLELLKSYALLNRTAFRKINKKYDKAVNARPSMRYMTEKVNKAWFVQSDVIEGHIRAVEDLYARYFEKGNHKVAVGKLRIKTARAGDFTENSFRNGLTLAAGLVFGVQGLVYGGELLYADDPSLVSRTSYLFQIYGGYFLVNLLFILFCLACRVWHESKINYVFVFEYDTRHHLDWRQLSELPCFFFFLLGFFMWLNFNQFGNAEMYIFYPVILIALTAIIIFLPLPILYYRSRSWLLYSVWRLFLAGLYPVEFRDFYLGDMFCSLTYTMGNIELFFCLYANDFVNPTQCNSSHSRLLGFFTTLPGIWRALQCLRRYYDTRNVFPHLVNCGKYCATILFYITLSLYRLNRNAHNRGIFITFAIINAVYCSIWDVFMDWSLGDTTARHRFLRKHLGYKRVWMYYLAMIVDPILRFNWIPYAILPLETQHSTTLSFGISLSEVCRRGLWTLFRVENEHCTNVGRFRASRDVPLPYDVPSPSISARSVEEERASREYEGHHPQVADHEAQGKDHTPKHKIHPTPPSLGPAAQSVTTSTDLEAQRTRSSTHSHRRRPRASTVGTEESPLQRGLTRVGTIIRTAHAQDFERRRKPELGKDERNLTKDDDGSSDDDDDEEDEDEGGGLTDDEEEEIHKDVEIGKGHGAVGE